jgi:carboxylate-amine ligase
VVLCAGLGVLAGQLWARIVGIVLAVISALISFTFIAAYPVWSCILTALNVLIIYALAVHGRRRNRWSQVRGGRMTTELQQEQIEDASPPQTTVAGQLEAIRTGRSLAQATVARAGGQVIALPTAPGTIVPHLTPDARYRRIAEQFGLTAAEQLSNGFHVHVNIVSRDEGVAVLDRIRTWLPTVLALSANSPFWQGIDTGYASYRYQVWARLPIAGPTGLFGSTETDDRHRATLLDTHVPPDAKMLYFDARLCEHQASVEVRITDVCLDPLHAAVIATMIRALVETAARAWTTGTPALPVPASVLRAGSWQASRHGAEDLLIDPSTGIPAPAGDAITSLLDTLGPVLAEHGEQSLVDLLVADILRTGTGAQYQREAYTTRHDLGDVMAAALRATHHVPLALPGPLSGSDPASNGASTGAPTPV